MTVRGVMVLIGGLMAAACADGGDSGVVDPPPPGPYTGRWVGAAAEHTFEFRLNQDGARVSGTAAVVWSGMPAVTYRGAVSGDAGYGNTLALPHFKVSFGGLFTGETMTLGYLGRIDDRRQTITGQISDGSCQPSCLFHGDTLRLTRAGQ